jgi:hypothetical protein
VENAPGIRVRNRWVPKKPISKFRKTLDDVPDHYLPRFIELVAEVVAPRLQHDQQLSRYLKYSESMVQGRVYQIGSDPSMVKRKLASVAVSSAKLSRVRAELLTSDGLLASAVQAAHNGHYVVNLDDWTPQMGGRLPQRKCSLGPLCENHAARTSKACVCQPTVALCPKQCFAMHCVSLGVAQTPDEAAHVAAAAVQAMPQSKPRIALIT